ncbi:cellulase family glycosylhydrolase [Subtercola vilae]|uniref:cellulase family glycosylhydrolase n=1 Tax=Subtercola vilae TaxID=2056433 RepID=UPI001EEECE44|nr:cellulase family glycosylhydrolase [Subtercola vilae]
MHDSGYRSAHRTLVRSGLRRLAAGAIALLLAAGGLSLTSATAATAASTAGGATATTPAPTTTPSGWLHTDGGSIKDSTGKTYVIKAAAWFGMETSNCAPHGLWSISLDAGLAQIRSMGFNTIRLPYSNECLAAQATTSINYAVNPTLKNLSPLLVLDAVVARAKVYGLSVILDQHRPDSGAQSELWYTAQYPESTWLSDWRMLAKRYASNPTVIGVDLHNEPHGSACWGCGTAAVDWQAAATRGGNAVLGVNPKLLVIVEGTDRQPDGTTTWWGGALGGVKAKPVTLSVAHQVVYSPHDYPSSVYTQSWFSAANYPANLAPLWDKNWGYLAKSNIAPVLLGEFGSTLATPSDTKWMTSIVSYLANTGISFAYWSFNPDSGDTGGLVKDDWVTPQAAKLSALKPLLGAGAPVPVQTPTPVPSTGTTTTPTLPITPTTPAPAPSPKPTTGTPPSSSPPPPPSPSPKPQPGTTGPPTASAAGPVAASASWALQSSWADGYVATVSVTSTTGASGWSVTWPDTRATAITNAWGMTCSLKASTSITCTGVDWGAAVGTGQTLSVGLQVAAPAAPTLPRLTVTAR